MDQAYAVVADKFASDQKSLCQTFRGRLYGVFQLQTQRVPVSQQTAECSLVFRCGDDQNFPDAAEHQYRQGVVDHRFVENGQQLFADPFGDGVQAGAAASGQDDSFHGKNFSVKLMFIPGYAKRRSVVHAFQEGAKTCHLFVKVKVVFADLPSRRIIRSYSSGDIPQRIRIFFSSAG